MNTIYFDAKLTPETVRQAAEIITRGGLLGIPTETVYGLGADALNEDAVLRIFQAKGRPQDNPLIIHVPDSSWLARYCENVPDAAYRAGRALLARPSDDDSAAQDTSSRCARRAVWRPSASAARTIR